MINPFCSPRAIELRAGLHRIQDAYRRRRPASRRMSRSRSQFYSELWHDAAGQIGAQVEDWGGDILEIRSDQGCTRVYANVTTLDDPVTITLARNKLQVYRLLSRQQLKIPVHRGFRLNEIDQAKEFARKLGGACVVKPETGSGGYAVTTGITTESQLIRGIVAAAAYCPSFVVEEHVPGDVYRLLYLDGKLLDAVLRGHPKVIGDGKSNVRELVRRENERRLKTGPSLAHDVISIDADMRHTLLRQGLSLSSVPKDGEAITVKTVINQNSQPDNVCAKEMLCQSVIDDGAAAAAAIGIRLAGIDVITRDPGVPLSESGGVITDVNPTPGLQQHYYKRDGGCPVARVILHCLLTEAKAHGALHEGAVPPKPRRTGRPPLAGVA